MKTEITLSEQDIRKVLESIYPGELTIKGLKTFKVKYVEEAPYGTASEPPIAENDSNFQIGEMVYIKYPGDIEGTEFHSKPAEYWSTPSHNQLTLATFRELVNHPLKVEGIKKGYVSVSRMEKFFKSTHEIDEAFLMRAKDIPSQIIRLGDEIVVRSSEEMSRLSAEEGLRFYILYNKYGKLEKVRKDLLEKHTGKIYKVGAKKGVEKFNRIQPTSWDFGSLPEIVCVPLRRK